MSRNNLFKFGVAAAAAGVGAILAITSVFAHSSPTASGHSIVGSIVKAEVAAGFPLVNFDAAPNTVIDEQAADAEEAAELAAAIAAQQAEQAAQAAELAKEQAAQAAEQQNADADDQQEGDVENQAGNSDQGNDQAGNSDQGGD